MNEVIHDLQSILHLVWTRRFSVWKRRVEKNPS